MRTTRNPCAKQEVHTLPRLVASPERAREGCQDRARDIFGLLCLQEREKCIRLGLILSVCV
eukprot:6172751-Pleurochrysis_carterae.AAC.4